MKNISLIAAIFIVILGGCKQTISEQKQREIEQSNFSVKEYADAARQADNNDPAGFVKLYKIATDYHAYTAEHNEAATEKLHYLLYSKTELWIKTFSRTDLAGIKEFLKGSGIWVIDYPPGVTSDEQFAEGIFSRLKKIKGDNKEMELINFILETFSTKTLMYRE